MERVSAIITTHGRLELLKKAIDSVKRQNYPNMEIIVVDDCSQDGTFDWMTSQNDSKMKYIYIPKAESKGGNHARNVGISAATGVYIAFLDDDDIWNESKISKQVEVLLANSDIGLVYCGHTKCYENGKWIDIIPDEAWCGDLSKKVLTQVFCTTSMIMAKKDIVVHAGMFDEDLKFWQEYDLCIRLCQLCKVGCVEETLVDILHSSSDTSRLSIKIDGWLEAVKYVDLKYKEEIDGLSKEDKQARQLMIFNDAANRCAAAHDMKRHQEFLKKAWEVDRSIKHWVKYKLNVTNYQMDLLRQLKRGRL